MQPTRGGSADPLPQRGGADAVGTQMGKLRTRACLSLWFAAEHPKETSQAVKISRLKSAKRCEEVAASSFQARFATTGLLGTAVKAQTPRMVIT